VVSRFNNFITDRLLAAASMLSIAQVPKAKNVDVVHVPGAFELPLAAKKLAATGRYDALSPSAASCAANHSLRLRLLRNRSRLAAGANGYRPTHHFCVLTCDTLEQSH